MYSTLAVVYIPLFKFPLVQNKEETLLMVFYKLWEEQQLAANGQSVLILLLSS